MLKLFRVQNFKQFNDLEIDFSRVRNYDYNRKLLSEDGELIKTVTIFGRNGSGKSNLGFAVFDIVHHLFDKVMLPEAYALYLNADFPKIPASFTYVFVFDSTTVTYSYKKSDVRHLVSEELTVDGKRVFRWDINAEADDFSHLKEFGFETLNDVYRERKMSFLRYIANNSSLSDDSPVRKLMDFVNGMLWFKRGDNGTQFMGLLSYSEDIQSFIINNHLLRAFEDHLASHDVHEKLIAVSDPMGNHMICFKHANPIPFTIAASSGTWALFVLFYWQQFFSKASFVFIDEFDALYHTSVAESVLNELIDLPIQVMVTTHNTNLINTKTVRPDCCFVVQHGGIKAFSDLTVREIRQGNNLEKLYLAGEFDV